MHMREKNLAISGIDLIRNVPAFRALRITDGGIGTEGKPLVLRFGRDPEIASRKAAENRIGRQ